MNPQDARGNLHSNTMKPGGLQREEKPGGKKEMSAISGNQGNMDFLQKDQSHGR
jgi:hypothetical protein